MEKLLDEVIRMAEELQTMLEENQEYLEVNFHSDMKFIKSEGKEIMEILDKALAKGLNTTQEDFNLIAIQTYTRELYVYNLVKLCLAKRYVK